MDETHVDGELGRCNKTSTNASSHRSGFKSVQKGSGNHATAALAASARRHFAPLFCSGAENVLMGDWMKPLRRTIFKYENGSPY